MHAQFEVELWISTVDTVPDTKIFKTVAASDHYPAAQEACRRVREENPEINAAKIDTWFAENLLDLTMQATLFLPSPLRALP